MTSAVDQRPSIRYAQNFLHDWRLVERLLDRAAIGPGDLVYEIGPGHGAITERLARRCRAVVAIEKDAWLAARLRKRFASARHVTIHEGDILTFPAPAERRGPYKVFANIPFNRTAAIVKHLTSASWAPEDTHLVVQREAAYRVIGRGRESLFSLLLKPWFAPAITYAFRRTDFTPQPQVDAVLLLLRKRGPPLIAPSDAPLFRDLVTYSYTAARPAVRAPLTRLFGARQLARLGAELGLDLAAGPASIRFEQWLVLFNHFARSSDVRARAYVQGADRRLRQQQAGLQKAHRTRVSIGRRRPPPLVVATPAVLTMHPPGLQGIISPCSLEYRPLAGMSSAPCQRVCAAPLRWWDCLIAAVTKRRPQAARSAPGVPRARWPRLLAYRLAGVRAEVWCALLLVMGANMLSVVARKSLTNDEVVHIPAAYAYLTRGNFRLNNEHPPLAKEWAALPLLFVGATAPDAGPAKSAVRRTLDYGQHFWTVNAAHYDALAFWARVPMVLLTLVLGSLIFWHTRDLFGAGGALRDCALQYRADHAGAWTEWTHKRTQPAQLLRRLLWTDASRGLWPVNLSVSVTGRAPCLRAAPARRVPRRGHSRESGA
jgi:23S rRNA (adenine-N6)-dimethyltransferase